MSTPTVLTPETKVEVLDYMLDKGCFLYHCDTWSHEPSPTHFKELSKLGGTQTTQINYNGEIFITRYRWRRNGSGGMDEGTPEGFTVIRVQQV